MVRPLNHASINPGRYSGLCASGPNYVTRWGRSRVSRLLYHSALDEVLEYPWPPNETLGFGYDLITKVDTADKKTFESTVVQQWAAVKQDVVIVERFNSPLAAHWHFFHTLHRFWTTVPSPGDFILWRPLDRTDKIYRVVILGITVDGEDMNLNPVSIQQPDKFTDRPIELKMRLSSSFPPTAVFFASGPILGTTGSGSTSATGV
jgi:hypothetical protein